MFKSRLWLYLAALFISVLLGARMASWPSVTPRSTAPSERPGPVHSGPPDARRPINLGLPQGPFDPILTQAPPAGRSVPPLNHRANNPAGEPVGTVQSECTIAIFGDTVVVGWNDGLGFVVPEAPSLSGYAYSVDRGETWIDGGPVPGGPNTSIVGDPTVAVTNSGQWIFVSLDMGNPAGLAVNKGRFHNGTLTWPPSVKYDTVNQYLDKEYIEYDPATNRLYMTYKGAVGLLTYSTNDGASWAVPLSVGEGGASNGFYPVPGVDGEVYVSWLNGLGTPSGTPMTRYSSDGGRSWAGSATPVVQLGTDSQRRPQCFNRMFNITYPSMSVDRTQGPHRGRAYLCYTDGAPGTFDTYVTCSDDKGRTWSPRFRLNDDTGASEQFWPQAHVGMDGRVSVGWYDRRNATENNSLCDFYITQSVDGGASWGPNRRLSDTSVAWCGVPANLSPNFGDYVELTSDDRSVFAVWSDARGGDPDVYVGRFDDRFLLSVNGTTGHERSTFAADGTVWTIPNETDFVAQPAPGLNCQAQLLVAAVGLGSLASPPETPGVFQVAGESLHGEVSFVSSQGTVNGTFSVARTGTNGVNFAFSSFSTPDLDGIQFLPNSEIHATLAPAGPGEAVIHGTASMARPSGPLLFSLDGAIHFDGSQASLAGNQSTGAVITTQLGPSLHMHTRTRVVDGVSVDIKPISAGTNPPPLATLRVAPNPLEANTRIAYTLTHTATGSIQIYSVEGRSVRVIAKGEFPAGGHEYPFDGNDDNGHRLARGGYFIRFDTDRAQVAGKLFVVR